MASVKDHDRPAASVRKFPTDGGLLLLDTSSNCLSVYNDSARQVWELLEQGRSGAELAAHFVARFDIPDEVARRDVRAMLRYWRSLGLLRTNGRRKPPIRRQNANVVTDWARAPKPRWAATLTCTIRDTVFAFAVEPPRTVAFLQIFFRHFETPGARADVRLEVREAGGGEAAVVVDGVELLRTSDAGQLIGAVNQTILTHIHPEIEWFAIIHGAAVARHGAGLAFPAACGSGKTTLTAYLLARGYDYLADDMIALAAPDGRIAPWPMPLSIKEGSWDVLSESYRNLPSFPQYRTKGVEARQLVPHPDVWNTDPVPLQSFIFPRYVPGGDAKLTRITPFEALERLLSDRIWLGYPIAEQRVRNFLAWLDDKPAYMLVHGNVADAARCIEGIL